MHYPFFAVHLELDIVHKPEDGPEFCVDAAFFGNYDGGAFDCAYDLFKTLRCPVRGALKSQGGNPVILR